jgi:AcrR family transcriptional regulator
VTAARLRRGRADELPGLADELAAWAACYPPSLPDRLVSVEAARSLRADSGGSAGSERARRAKGRRLPSGRHALPRTFILKSQRERIVDATASIVAARGLAGLTIPEIARRANVSHQTFYEIYETKHDAFLGALKVGMHQALLVFAKAYDAHSGDWPRALAGGLRALIEYVVSEPVHAHLSLVDTFAASPEAIEIRDSALAAFAAHLTPGYALARGRQEVPLIAVEAITGGVWQILHDYVDDGRISELGKLAPQVSYLALVPFLGSAAAADAVS